MRSKTMGCLLAATIPTFVTFSAYAQQGGGLEEIVVTATRREQNLQEVPISIVAVTGESLQMRGLDSLERVSQSIPNLVVTGGPGGTGGTGFTVRGIPNVGTYVDGIWQVGTNGLLTEQFVDIDRVEVLRGPQGTEFGRDSTGGAIRIWTKKPSDEYNGDVTVTAGSYDRHDVTASVDVPLTDKLLSRFTGASLNRDGYIDSLTTGVAGGNIDQQVARADLLWTPTDKLTWRFNYQYDDNKSIEPRIQDAIFPTTPLAGQAISTYSLYVAAGAGAYDQKSQQAGYPGGEVGQWQNKSNVYLPNDITNKQFSSDVSWQLTDKMKLQFVTAQTSQDVKTIIDWDNSQWDLVADVNQNQLRVFSQEIQLTGGGDRVKWVGGAYYWDQTNDLRSTRYSVEEFISGLYNINTAFANPICTSVHHADPHPPAAGGPLKDCQDVYAAAIGGAGRYDRLTRVDENGWAAFGEATISLTSKIDMTLGMRHHKQDDKTQPLAFVPGVTGPRPASPNDRFIGNVFEGSAVGIKSTPSSFDKNTYRFSVQDQFTKDVMGYIGYSEGFNSGGASAYIDGAGNQQVSPYKPQLLKNTEIGVRSDLANKHLRLNATIFHTDWEDIQALGRVFGPNGELLPQLLTTNIGTALAQGAELELIIVPTEKWLFNLNLGYLDAKYTNIAPGTLGTNLDTEFQQAPKHTGSAGIQYTASLKQGSSIVTRVDYLYQSTFWRFLPFLRTDFWGLPASYSESGGQGVVNLRMQYNPGGGKWNLAVFGTNLTNEQLINSGFFDGIWGFDFATVGRPREGGVQFNFKFQ